MIENASKNYVGKFKPLPMVNFEFELPHEQIESSSNRSAVTSSLSKDTSTPTQQTIHSVSEQRSDSTITDNITLSRVLRPTISQEQTSSTSKKTTQQKKTVNFSPALTITTECSKLIELRETLIFEKLMDEHFSLPLLRFVKKSSSTHQHSRSVHISILSN